MSALYLHHENVHYQFAADDDDDYDYDDDSNAYGNQQLATGNWQLQMNIFQCFAVVLLLI